MNKQVINFNNWKKENKFKCPDCNQWTINQGADEFVTIEYCTDKKCGYFNIGS